MIRTVLFDLDGTLVDTAADMVDALNAWLYVRRKPLVDLRMARGLCSGGSRALLDIRGVGEEGREAAVADYLRLYEKTDYRKTVYFAGVQAMLSLLHSAAYRCGVVTNKPRRYAAPICERLRVADSNLTVLVCGDDTPRPKPSPLPLLAAAEQFGVRPEECLYVGDDRRDAVSADAAGMPFVGALWGYWQAGQWRDEDCPPVAALLSTPVSLLPTIRALP